VRTHPSLALRMLVDGDDVALRPDQFLVALKGAPRQMLLRAEGHQGRLAGDVAGEANGPRRLRAILGVAEVTGGDGGRRGQIAVADAHPAPGAGPLVADAGGGCREVVERVAEPGEGTGVC